FQDTIGNNIRYGRENATDEDIRKAAETSESDEFINRLPEGYNTVLSEGGSNLSQGQRQLLAIARAVLADPKILILDEATSSVDTRTEMHIQQAMVALMKNRTSLIIAHRLSTIRDADMIIVMKDGAVMETGSHEELLAKEGIYYDLYQNQFAGFET
ncbi:MAG: ATP-binding cassette domain-containing protein, partial [Ruminococcaceae bacterium]|nr:ATP-binding cassette domain-containing protein [Oscillospiraceae bacterium]